MKLFAPDSAVKRLTFLASAKKLTNGAKPDEIEVHTAASPMPAT